MTNRLVLFDLDFDRISRALDVAGQKIRAHGFDWFGPEDIGETPDDRPITYAAKKVRRLQKTRRPAAYLSRSNFRFAATSGHLEIGVYIPRGWNAIRPGDIDERIAAAFVAAGFEQAWPHPDAPGVIQALVSAFGKRERSPRARPRGR